MGRAWIAAVAVLAAGCSLFVPEPKSGDGFTDGDTDGDTVWDGMDGMGGFDVPDTPLDELPSDCTTGDHLCFGNDYYRCNDSGTGWDMEQECGNGQVCDDALGCTPCVPGQVICLGTVSVMCDPSHSNWLTIRNCTDWGSTCGPDGYCDDACGEAESEMSHYGCEFWAVPLANPSGMDPDHFLFGIWIANPNGDTANVHLTQGATDEWHDVGPNEQRVLEWHPDASLVGGLPEGGWESFFVMNGSIRITSDIPVSVMQMIPKDFDYSERMSPTTASSLLLPRHVLANDVHVASVPPMNVDESGAIQRWASYAAIAGTTSPTTRVRVEPGLALALDAHGRLTGGTFTEFDLGYGEVVHLAQELPDVCTSSHSYVTFVSPDSYYCYDPFIDPSNMKIWTDQPVAVFGGAVNQYVPFTVGDGDHLEEQMPPTVALGQEFVTAPMYDPEATAVSNVVRITFPYDGTTLTIEPLQEGHGDGEIHGGGGTLEFTLTDPVWIWTGNPVLVAQYLVGQESTDPAMVRGDPAMTVIVPVDQYKYAYSFAAPGSFTSIHGGMSYVMVIRHTGVELTHNGGSFIPYGGWYGAGDYSRNWEVARVQITDRLHTISSEEDFGLQVYGLGPDVAYAHPAGMRLDWINEPVD